MSKPVVFVIGASGNIGSATVTALAAKYGDKLEIRAGVRNPDKAADKLKIPGVTVVKADMGGDKASLVSTLKGVDALFIVTPGNVENRVKLVMAAAEAGKEAGVKFLMTIGVVEVKGRDTAINRQFEGFESKIAQLGVPYAIICLPFFMENEFGNKDSIQGQSAIYGSVSPDKPFAKVAVEDAGNACAAILSDYSKHIGKTYTIISEHYTQGELAAAFSKALGREIKYIQIPFDVQKKGMIDLGLVEWAVDGLIEIFKFIEEGVPEAVLPGDGDYKKITGADPTTLDGWLSKYGGFFK
jgi:uncharacterized protein YbjT (DUF2867 family)